MESDDKYASSPDKKGMFSTAGQPEITPNGGAPQKQQKVSINEIDDGPLNPANWSSQDKFQFGLKFFVSLISCANLTLDIVYIIESFFAMKFLFYLMCIFLAVRLFLNLALGQWYYHRFVRNHMSVQEMDQAKGLDFDNINDEQLARSTEKFKIVDQAAGSQLYTSMHILFVTGFYHILPVKDFATELFQNHLIESVFSIALFFSLECMNNVFIENAEPTNLQSYAVLMKLLCAICFFIELISYCWQRSKNARETGKNHQKASENERRRRWARFSQSLAGMSLIIMVVLIIGGILFQLGSRNIILDDKTGELVLSEQ